MVWVQILFYGLYVKSSTTTTSKHRNLKLDEKNISALLLIDHFSTCFTISTICFPSYHFIAAEPTRQPTTKRRKRKNSTSSTSNSSAGNNANSTNSKKKSAAANLSLSSQVPVSLTFLLGLNCLCCFNSFLTL